MQQDMAWIQHRYGINLAQIWHRYGRDAFGGKKNKKTKFLGKNESSNVHQGGHIIHPPPLVLVVFPKNSCYLEDMKSLNVKHGV